MANRSMLPKFRPATLNGSDRPKIRPVKPSAPPQPPRRHSSGIRNERADEHSPPTQNYGEPPTMAAARARIHEIARELPAENRFGGAHAGGRFDDETQGRIEGADLAAAHAAYDRQFGAPAHQDHYDQGYSNGVDSYGQPQHEHYDAEYQHQDPMTELRPAYDEALNRHEGQYGRNGSDRPLSDRPLPEDDSSGEYRRRGQHDRGHEQAGAYNSNSYDAAAYEANYPKPARREEPSYVDRAPSSDRPSDRSGERGSSRGQSFRNDDFPREKSSYRDEPRERGSIRREEKSSYRRDEERDSDRGNSFGRREREDDRKANSYQPSRAEPADHTRAEGSGAKHASERSYSKNEPSIPGPARVPAELRVPDNFVVGVQPIRTPSLGVGAQGGSAYPQPQAVIAPAYGPPPATMAASPGALGGSMPPGMPQITMPPMMAPSSPPMQGQMPYMAPMTGPMGGMSAINAMNQGMHVRAHTSMRPGGHVAQPTEVEEAAQGSKVGRFAWFVFGAAFGIFFAFAATGFGFGKKDEPQGNFPPPAQLPAPVQTVQPPAPPPVVVPQPQIQQPMMPAPQVQMQQQLAPAVAPPGQMGAPPPGVITNGQQVAPIVPAPQPPQAAPRGQQQFAQNQGTVRVRPAPAPAPRRPVAARPAPRGGDDDDAPAPKKSSAKDDDAASILGAAL